MAARASRLERLIGRVDKAHLPAWLRPTLTESRWPAGVAVLTAIALQVLLINKLAFSPKWLLPGIEFALLAVLTIANPVRINRESTILRAVGIALVAVASVATAWSAARLVDLLVHREKIGPGQLLLNGGAIWLTNVIVFALWYWEVDRGGPAARANARHDYPDFLFPQMTLPELTAKDWEPTFVDYFYLSFTNATAFSPTDTLPLSHWAKLAMAAESAVSLVTVVLLVARAVNILGA
jgi:branched-subunit amino acid transport protein